MAERRRRRTTKPFDLSGKVMLDLDPAALVALAGIEVPPGAAVVVDGDLSDVTAASDKVIRVGGDGPAAFVVVVEFQSTADPDFPARLLLYTALARVRHRLPVRAVVIAFRPAVAASVPGRLVEGTWLAFEYTVVRLWELQAERLLAGPVALLPFAPVSDVPADRVPGMVERVKERLLAELPRDRAAKLGQATEYLLGLYYDEAQAEALMGSFADVLRESSVYKAEVRRLTEARENGLAEGKVEGEQAMLLRVAAAKLGRPSKRVVARVRAITDSDALAAVSDRLLAAGDWDELLAGH